LAVRMPMSVRDGRAQEGAAARARERGSPDRVLVVRGDSRGGPADGGRDGRRRVSGQVMVSEELAPVHPGAPILQVIGLVKHFSTDRGLFGGGAKLHAVAGVDLEIFPGEVLAVVGESGSGKSTLARCILRLIDPTAGRIVFDGEDVLALKGRRLAGFRQQV